MTRLPSPGAFCALGGSSDDTASGRRASRQRKVATFAAGPRRGLAKLRLNLCKGAASASVHKLSIWIDWCNEALDQRLRFPKAARNGYKLRVIRALHLFALIPSHGDASPEARARSRFS